MTSTTTTKARRPRGAGAIVTRGSGRAVRYKAQYRLDDGTLRSRTFSRKGDAEAWLRDEHRRREEGTVLRRGDETVADVCAEWMALQAHRLEPTTLRGYRTIVVHRWVPTIGAVKLRDLRAGHVADALAGLRAGGRRRGEGPLTERSLEQSFAVLRKIVAYAVKAGYLARNVVDDVERPRPAQQSRTVWDGEQLGAVLAWAADDPLYPVWHVLAHTGLRRSEALGLKWGDVDLGRAVLTVDRRRVRTDSGMVERAGTKTPRGRRGVDLNSSTAAVLQALAHRQEQDRETAGQAWAGTGLVFVDMLGVGLNADVVSDRWAALVRRPGCPAFPIRLHDLRHVHASVALRAGVPPHVVSRRLGHASEAFTLSTYAHLLDGQGGEAAAAFEAAVSGRPALVVARPPDDAAVPVDASLMPDDLTAVPPDRPATA